jgi:KDO2-lipid IV(A) lauroyltransferase
MARKRGGIGRWLGATTTIFFGYFTYCLPLSLVRALGRGSGTLAYYLVPRIRKVGFENLDLAYGDSLSRAEKKRILLRATQNVGLVGAEFSRIPALQGDKLDSLASVEGLEHLPTDSGVAVMAVHMSNWEWMALILCANHPRVSMLVRPLDDPRLNRLVDRVRRSTGVTCVDREGAQGEVFRLLREGYIVGIMGDQSPRTSAVPVNFFGHPCWASIGPVMAALRGKVPVHLATMVRSDDGHYTLKFSEEIPLIRSGQVRRDLVENSQRCQDAIEAAVREHPDQWLWLHRRWKKRDRLQREWDARSN